MAVILSKFGKLLGFNSKLLTKLNVLLLKFFELVINVFILAQNNLLIFYHLFAPLFKKPFEFGYLIHLFCNMFFKVFIFFFDYDNFILICLILSLKFLEIL